MRTGQQYLDSLADNRAVYVHGERVADVRQHAAFRGITRTVAGLYDFAVDPANEMQFTAPRGQ
jgi:4-hydroxyphenylacetate 3-monooxygenase